MLDHVVANQILPRLAWARRATDNAARAGTKAALTTEVDTETLVCLLLNQEAHAAIAFIELLEVRGATPESLYLGLLSAAACALGLLWEQDRCDFAQVTISVGRLQQLARFLSSRFQAAAVRRPDPDSVLLVPAPGEQHTFGLIILAEFFQRAGWHVAGGPMAGGMNPAEAVRSTWFDIAGFSIGSESRLEALAKDIRRVRRASRNRDLGVMVGGPLFLQRPDLVARVGADMAAVDAPSAVQQARSLLATRAAAD
jgi:methanogenic corrinoid protein MtbC1